MKILSFEMTAANLKVSALALGRVHRLIARNHDDLCRMLSKTDRTLTAAEAGEQLRDFRAEQAAPVANVEMAMETQLCA